jgi:uncharacterized membrane protein
MARVHRSILIHAPIERVFEYMADPIHLPEIWPSMIMVRNVTPSPRGNSFDWDYKMLGVRIQGHSEAVEIVKNERHVTRSEKGIPNTFRWLYVTKPEGTEVTLEVDYEVPVLGRLAEGIVGRVNEREGEMMLKNLKIKMEA